VFVSARLDILNAKNVKINYIVIKIVIKVAISVLMVYANVRKACF